VVAGCAGSRKTTLAREVAARLDARHIERDALGDDEAPALTVTQENAALTILTALASAYSAIRTRPLRVPVLAGAAATVATAPAAFGLHVSPTWIGAEMPVVSLVAGLLLRMHVSPKLKGIPAQRGGRGRPRP
jgi:hypothetical protein